jgi:hypothetical protein
MFPACVPQALVMSLNADMSEEQMATAVATELGQALQGVRAAVFLLDHPLTGGGGSTTLTRVEVSMSSGGAQVQVVNNIPCKEGVAGLVVATCGNVVLAEAHNNPQFNKRVDVGLDPPPPLLLGVRDSIFYLGIF